jgi:nitrite reductase/ring-hydroxylating ferredoxin subunit
MAASSSDPGAGDFDTGLSRADLDPERPRPLDTPWGPFALYLLEGEVIAASSFCPHLLGPLFQGTLAGSEMTCPWHGWRYSLVDGRCTHRPEGRPEAAPPIAFLRVSLSPAGTYRLARP